MKMIGATLGIVMLAGTAHAKPYGPSPTGSDGRWSMKYERQAVTMKRTSRSIRHRSFKRRPLHGYTKIARHRGGGSVTLSGVISPLADKAREIMSACGSRIISAYRPGDPLLHGRGRAVDIQGNPSCIYAHLGREWLRVGGYTIDYATAPAAPHVHVSYGGIERGLRFVHRHYRTRYAYHRRVRYSRI